MRSGRAGRQATETVDTIVATPAFHRAGVPERMQVCERLAERKRHLVQVEFALEHHRNDIGGARFYDGPSPAERHFSALKRILDRQEPDYAL